MIPQDKIDEIRDRADIVDIVSDYVVLKPRGHNHIGLCPFHSEKTPSFTVSEDKNIFYCFGCGAGGNAMTFLMKHEGLEFPDAVRSLAERYGIAIVETRGSKFDEEAQGISESIRKMNTLAMGYFKDELSGEGGKKAREYLTVRGFLGEMSDKFRLGYAPDGWDGLSEFLKKKGADMDIAVKGGLLGQKEKRFYDRFRDRIIFPITDFNGKVVGFGGRILGEGEPKYLNSPETVLFKKAEILYGFYQAKEPVKQKGALIIVEGYFDLIALHKAGFFNCAATMGTALTSSHLRKIKRYGATIYTLFDGDEAGKKAALRGIDDIITYEVSAKVVQLPEGQDPDDFLKSEGAEGLEKAIAKAEPIMEFYLSGLKDLFDIKTAEGKGGYFSEVMKKLKLMQNAAVRGHYVTRLASILAMDARLIYDALGDAVGDALSEDSEVPDKISGLGVVKRARPEVTRLAESTILKVILRHPELYNDEVKGAFLRFNDSLYKEVAGFLVKSFIEGVKSSECFLEKTDNQDITDFIAHALIDEEAGFIEAPDIMLKESVEKILNAGRPKDTTLKILKLLEESGRSEEARKVGARFSDDILAEEKGKDSK
jgi:DNA primase